MQKIMFNERYGLQSAVFEGRKTQTRREPFFSDVEIETHFDIETGKFFVIEKDSRKLIHTSRYAIGEIVAIAQSYKDAGVEPNETIDAIDYGQNMYMPLTAIESKGWKNKMFVKAELMPLHIRITNIRCERLHDISDDDCLKEGVIEDLKGVQYSFSAPLFCGNFPFDTPRGAFSVLIDRLSGKGFWESNPYVIVYEFELV